MKRFSGWVLAVAGGVATIWGAISALTGASQSKVVITPDFAPTAMMVGLAGLAVLVVGLVWVRD